MTLATLGGTAVEATAHGWPIWAQRVGLVSIGLLIAFTVWACCKVGGDADAASERP